MVGLGGIQFCKLLLLSKLENCSGLAEALLFQRSVYCAHKGLLVAYTPCRQKPQKILTKARNRARRYHGEGQECCHPVWIALALNKRKYHERRRRVLARRPLNGSFLLLFAAVGCCQANSSCCCFCGGNGENCCSKSNWFSHVP